MHPVGNGGCIIWTETRRKHRISCFRNLLFFVSLIPHEYSLMRTTAHPLHLAQQHIIELKCKEEYTALALLHPVFASSRIKLPWSNMASDPLLSLPHIHNPTSTAPSHTPHPLIRHPSILPKPSLMPLYPSQQPCHPISPPHPLFFFLSQPSSPIISSYPSSIKEEEKKSLLTKTRRHIIYIDPVGGGDGVSTDRSHGRGV